MIKIKRIYDNLEHDGGYRVLVDRLWPRGVSKEEAHVNLWLKDVAPTDELRQWFSHDPKKWLEFKQKYIQELIKNPAIPELQQLVNEHKNITLLYGTSDEKRNQAVVLKTYLEQF